MYGSGYDHLVFISPPALWRFLYEQECCFSNFYRLTSRLVVRKSKIFSFPLFPIMFISRTNRWIAATYCSFAGIPFFRNSLTKRGCHVSRELSWLVASKSKIFFPVLRTGFPGMLSVRLRESSAHSKVPCTLYTENRRRGKDFLFRMFLAFFYREVEFGKLYLRLFPKGFSKATSCNPVVQCSLKRPVFRDHAE